MTWPINVVEELREAELTDSTTPNIDYKGLQAIQLSYKSAILRSKTVATFFHILLPSLDKSKL